MTTAIYVSTAVYVNLIVYSHVPGWHTSDIHTRHTSGIQIKHTSGIPTRTTVVYISLTVPSRVPVWTPTNIISLRVLAPRSVLTPLLRQTFINVLIAQTSWKVHGQRYAKRSLMDWGVVIPRKRMGPCGLIGKNFDTPPSFIFFPRAPCPIL